MAESSFLIYMVPNVQDLKFRFQAMLIFPDYIILREPVKEQALGNANTMAATLTAINPVQANLT